MRQFVVRYKDNEMSNREEVFETRACPRRQAEELVDMLKTMHCHDINLVEIKLDSQS